MRFIFNRREPVFFPGDEGTYAFSFYEPQIFQVSVTMAVF